MLLCFQTEQEDHVMPTTFDDIVAASYLRSRFHRKQRTRIGDAAYTANYLAQQTEENQQNLPKPEEIAALSDEQAAELEMLFCGPDTDCSLCTQAHRDAFEKRRKALKK